MTMPSHVSLREVLKHGAEADVDMEEALTGTPAKPADLLPLNSTIIDRHTEICATPLMKCQQVVVAHAHTIVQVQEV